MGKYVYSIEFHILFIPILKFMKLNVTTATEHIQIMTQVYIPNLKVLTILPFISLCTLKCIILDSIYMYVCVCVYVCMYICVHVFLT